MVEAISALDILSSHVSTEPGCLFPEHSDIQPAAFAGYARCLEKQKVVTLPRNPPSTLLVKYYCCRCKVPIVSSSSALQHDSYVSNLELRGIQEIGQENVLLLLCLYIIVLDGIVRDG